jgi:predicted transposase YbfD/YdcC
MGVLKIADLGHWMLLFRSDNSRIRKVHSPENFAFLRRECGQFTETGERI